MSEHIPLMPETVYGTNRSPNNLDVYICSPYTSTDKEIQQLRFTIADWWFAYLCKCGLTAFSPISMSHSASIIAPAYDWLRIDKKILPLCNCLHVLGLPGYDKSAGVREEILLAISLNKPIRFFSIEELKSCPIDQESLSRLMNLCSSESKDFYPTDTKNPYLQL